ARLQLRRAQVGPDHAAPLEAWVGRDLDLVLEVALRGLAWHFHAVTAHVILPAVVDAAQTGLLVAAEEERGATVRAVAVDESDRSVAVPKRDQVLAEKGDAHRRTVRVRQLVGQQARHPEPAH